MGTDATDSAVDVEDAATRMRIAVKKWKNDLIAAARGVITTAYQIISDKAELAAANVESAELRKVIATGHATKEQKARYTELGESQALLILSLAENGVKGGKEVNTAMNQIRERLKTATGQERKALLATLAVLKQIAAQAARTATSIRIVNSILPGDSTTKGGKVRRAHGGPVVANKPYIVGENRPEVFVPDQSGYVYPDIQTGLAATSGGGGDTIINVPVQGLMPIRSPRDIVTELIRVRDVGILPQSRVAPMYRRPPGT